MFIRILCLLYAVSAQPPYSRKYLRGLKKVEDERIQAEFINIGFAHIESAVFTAAKQGFLKVRTLPFPECKEYHPSDFPGITTDQSDKLFAIHNMEKDVCENIINGIKSLVLERFPDSEVIYNPTTKRYTIKWN